MKRCLLLGVILFFCHNVKSLRHLRFLGDFRGGFWSLHGFCHRFSSGFSLSDFVDLWALLFKELYKIFFVVAD